MRKLKSKCCRAKVDKGIAMLPIIYQKNVRGEAYSYICRKCGNPAEVEKVRE